MKRVLAGTGSIAGAGGLLLCLAAGLARLTGSFHVAGFEAMTLFDTGVGLMVAGCLFRLHALDRA